MGEALEGLAQGAWALLLCGPVLVASVAATVFVVRRRALLEGTGQADPSDQLFWDLFLGACVAGPALLIPTLVAPWTGVVLGGVAVAAGVAAYRGTPRYLARHAARREVQAQAAARLAAQAAPETILPACQGLPGHAAQARHDELIARWRRYELDPACSIDYPALTDVRLPETSALIKAMRTADELRSDSHRGYPDAVTHLAASLAAAERAAGMPAEQA